MAKFPNPSKLKEVPKESDLNKDVPVESDLLTEQPEQTPKLEVIPIANPLVATIPEITPRKEEMPSDFIEENCVIVKNKKIEIKPTKLKYFRNKAASAYGVIKTVPLHELLTVGKGVLDPTRDADQLLYDFLVAVFDDSTFVRDNYDDLDADTIDKIVKIFGRINHVDEKEETARKNREAQAQPKP